jgi:predicted DNA-binding protein
MKTKPQKPVTPKPVSLRINPETRALLDYLIERTGLKEAQIIRMAIKQMEERERSQFAAAPKPARKTR